MLQLCKWLSIKPIVLCLLVLANSPTLHAQEVSTNTDDLSMRSMIRLVHQSPDQFEQTWSARRRQQLDSLKSRTLAHDELRRATRQIDWEWAAGLIDYPYFRQRETGQEVASNWKPRAAAISSIPFDDETAIGHHAFDRLIKSWLHDQAGKAIQTNPIYKSGDNRWLRANFDALQVTMQNNRVKAHFMAKILAEHIDENGARNVLPQIEAFERVSNDATLVAKFRAAYSEEIQVPNDHLAYAYENRDGVDLNLHIFQPKAVHSKKPVLIWFHGGSWSTGHWSYCPVICKALQGRGYTVVQVEYRTSQRFDGTPLNALADAQRAIDWVLEHAETLGIDPKRLMVGGYSSGGTLASQLTFLNSNKVKAAATISAAYDPSKDSWYNHMVGSFQDSKTLSPLFMAHGNNPPHILFHAKDDEMCAFQDAESLAVKLEKLKVPNKLVRFDQGGHFFVFRSPADRQRIIEELNSFLDQLMW